MSTPSTPLGTAVEVDAALPMVAAVPAAVWDAAIVASERTPRVTLRADFERDGFNHPLADLTAVCESITIHREVSSGQLPPEVGLIDGYSVASLDATLAGRWDDDTGTDLSPAQVFSPYRVDSPLYQKPVLQAPVEADIGFVTDAGPKLSRRFTGRVKRVAPTSSSRRARFSALDPGNRLRQPITLSANGLDAVINKAVGGEVYRSRYNSQWLVDYILRRNGIYASPPARDDAILSVTGHGSCVPEVGWGGAPEYYGSYRGDTWVKDGPFNMLTAYDNNGLGVAGGRWWVEQPISAAPGTGIGFSGWFRMYPNMASARNDIVFAQISLTTAVRWGFNEVGQPYVVFLADNSTPSAAIAPVTVPATGGWAFVGCHIALAASTMAVTFRVRFAGQASGTTYTQTVSGVPARTSDYYLAPYLFYRTFRSFTNLQMWLSPTAPPTAGWVGESWVPQAELDVGANELTAFPEVIERDSLSLLREIVAAEFGAFGFYEDGRAWFRSRLRPDPSTQPVTEKITAQRNLVDMATTADEASIRNSISLITTPTFVQDWDYVIKAQTVEEFDLAPYASTIFLIGLPPSTYSIARDGWLVFSQIPYDSSTDWGKRDQVRTSNNKFYLRYAAVHRDLPDTQHDSTGISFYTRRASPFAMLLIGTNLNNHWIRFQTPNKTDADGILTLGEPAFEIPVRQVLPEAPVVTRYKDQTSIDRWGLSTYDMGGQNQWRQWPSTIGDVTADVLSQTANPIPVLDTIRVPHDPRRKLFDRVTVADPDGLGQVDALIAGILTTIDLSNAGGGFGDGDGGAATDDITARPLRSPGF